MENSLNQQTRPPEQPVPQPVPVVKPFLKKDFKKTFLMVAGVILIVLAGIGTGWILTGGKKSGAGTVPGAKTGPKEAGLADEATFRDTAQGILEEGGVNGEGTHHLVREGGPSQNVYLTSTVIDLEAFLDQKVQVWGETIAGKKTGWLMDVGKIKVIE